MAGPSAAASRPETLKLVLPCDRQVIRAAVQTICTFLTEQGWPGIDVASLELGLTEACNNAVKHAGAVGKSQPIAVEAISENTQVELRVQDHTAGFDWPQEIQLPEPGREGGRGLYLIKSVTDYAGYFRGKDSNILVMRKSRPAPTAAAASANAAVLTAKLAESEIVINDLVEELSSCYENLSAIFRYSAAQGRAENLKDFAHSLFGDLLKIVAADWFVLRLVLKREGRLAVFAASEPPLELDSLVLTQAGATATSRELQAVLTRQTIWFRPTDPLAADDPLVRTKPGSSGMVLPIVRDDELVGTLAIGKVNGAPGSIVFTAAHAGVIGTFAEFLGIQLANARYQEEHVRARLISHELEIANNIQRSLLPAGLPSLPGFSLAGHCRNAREVGGDFYDAHLLDDHSLLLAIADVMGKGVPAAMFAAILRTVLRAAPELAQQPAALLARVNRLLFPELTGVDMFITAQLAFVDARSRKITVAGAGHCPLTIVGAGSLKTVSPEGMPLGVMPDILFQAETIDLPENCRVLMYTDGVTDALNPRGERFGQSRLVDWFKRAAAGLRSADHLKAGLIAELDGFQSGTAPEDDQTFMLMAG